ncbi:MAG: hypothetical protein AB7N76_20480 [Planctomycetota bacterium]
MIRKQRRRQAMVEYMLTVLVMGTLSFKVAGDLGREMARELNACSKQLTTQLTDVLTGRRAPVR